MNKSFTAAIAIAATAGLACAEIATAPAGYAESDASSSTAQYVCNPFNSFSGSAPTLGDIDGSSLDSSLDYIIVVNSDGSKNFKARYLNAAEAEAAEKSDGAGWYVDNGSGSYGDFKNGYRLDRGKAIQFAGSGATKLVMAGTLNTTSVTLSSLSSGYNFIGNAMPTNCPLNNVTLTGNSYKYAYDWVLLDGEKYVYLPSQKGTYAPGWYYRDYLLFGKAEKSGLQNPPITSGEGFILYTKNAGVTASIR